MTVKMLIVDDEPVICQGLKETIDWQSIGVEVIGTAFNGKKALEVLNRDKVDLILTDISMPEMDGLQLAEHVVSNYPDIKMIIISGYDEFEYARKAIRIGVEDYLLKPVNVDELLNLVKKVATTILENQEISSYPKEAGGQLIAALLKQDEKEIKSGITYTCSVLEKYSPQKALPLYQKLVLTLKQQLQDRLPNKSFDQVELNLFENKELRSLKHDFETDVLNLFNQLKDSEGVHWIIENIKRYIDKNYQQDLRASDVAEQHYISPNYFSMLFKQETGRSFSEYLNGLRINKASKLLLETSNKVFEIAEYVGYKEYKYFVQVFKKQVGVTPTEYRRLNASHDLRKK
ncbi:response regulator transcription factor [Alkalicoccobacillus gibsonii]|uniref:response regulator transcription factor n=1 Tax=Alkalicoccobacillus gibsonii TaxID=79881 RepID=UPI003518EA0A